MKTNPDKISVIMNCHNGEKYLKQSIISVLNQSYKNWELIFFDNKSKDKSISIIKEFKDKRIKIYQSKIFLNLYSARNHAIQKATGKYITFLDTDDLWKKNFIKEHIKAFENDKSRDVVFSKYNIYNQKKKIYKINFEKRFSSKDLTQQLFDNYFIGILAIMLKKKIFKNHKFNSKFNIIGDFDLFTLLSLKYNFYGISKPLSIYRIHENNYSSKKLKTYIREFQTWIKNNKRKYKKFDLFKIKYFLFKLRMKYLLNFLIN